MGWNQNLAGMRVLTSSTSVLAMASGSARSMKSKSDAASQGRRLRQKAVVDAVRRRDNPAVRRLPIDLGQLDH